MTLAQIIAAALEQLDRSNDAQMQEVWGDKLTRLANDGLIDLAAALRLRRNDEVEVHDGVIDISTLPYECLKIIGISQDGKRYRFWRDQTTYEFKTDAEGKVRIEYRYLPDQLSSNTDIPGIPERLHSLLVTYIVAREYTTNDAATQRRAEYFYQLYEQGKRRAEKMYGEPAAYAIFHKYD